ncbi:acetate--CoA ligase family protein [Desulfotomaculum copahuensis]|uniref:ATP-grasp domain-containing protein n=1 Tax=Desulfotomaculum copahuensis TaxID=1838280 RepID=A0A1B7LDQ4_9FIRM|nr:acetate--CoA ligase family protein [Desulfotomaculum copahuensis]OAT81182.1 hypothetical protein A6M21_11635 [Desulfotomaculum copahuensis]
MEAGKIIATARDEGRHFLFEDEAKALLAASGIPVTPCRRAGSEEEAVSLAAEMGYPVVLKVRSALIQHKSDLGGVVLNLADEQAVRRAFQDILQRAAAVDAAAAVTVQPMAPPGIEVITGLVADRQFGPVLMFGLGGVFTEVLRDVCFRLVPVTPAEAREMTTAIKGSRLLDGFRGGPPADRQALADLLLAVSNLAVAVPGIKEMDLNPVTVYSKGLLVLDARVLLA